MNNTKPEMKNTLEIINIRITETEELKENWKTKWQKSTARDQEKKNKNTLTQSQKSHRQR